MITNTSQDGELTVSPLLSASDLQQVRNDPSRLTDRRDCAVVPVVWTATGVE